MGRQSWALCCCNSSLRVARFARVKLTCAYWWPLACCIPGCPNKILYAVLNADFKLPLSREWYWTLYIGWNTDFYLVIASLKPWTFKVNAKILRFKSAGKQIYVNSLKQKKTSNDFLLTVQIFISKCEKASSWLKGIFLLCRSCVNEKASQSVLFPLPYSSCFALFTMPS